MRPRISYPFDMTSEIGVLSVIVGLLWLLFGNVEGPSSMRRIISAAGLVAVIALAIAWNFLRTGPNQWRWISAFEVTSPGWVRLELPPEVLDGCNASLGDIKVISPTGEETKFWFDTRTLDGPVTDVVPARVSRTPEGGTEFLLTISPGKPVTSIDVPAPHDEYVLAAMVEARRGEGDWEMVLKDGLIYRRKWGGSQRSLRFAPQVADEIRVTLGTNELNWQRTDRVWIKRDDIDRPLREISAEVLSHEDGSNDTRYELDAGFRNLPVCGIRLDVADGEFQADGMLTPWGAGEEQRLGRAVLAHDSFHRFTRPFPSVSDAIMGNNRKRLGTRYFELRLSGDERGRNHPQRATLFYRPTFIVFRAPEAGVWRLMTGDPAALLPEGAFEPAVPDGVVKDAARLVAGKPVENPDHRPPAPGVDSIASHLRSDWSFARRLEVPEGRLFRWRLDSETLAATNDDFSDLRLVRDGQEIPFQIDASNDPALRRGMMIADRFIRPDPSWPKGLVTGLPMDPERPDVRRWKVAFETGNLPVDMAVVVPGSRDLINRRMSRSPGGSPGGRFEVSPPWKLVWNTTAADGSLVEDRVLATPERRPTLRPNLPVFDLGGRRIPREVVLEGPDSQMDFQIAEVGLSPVVVEIIALANGPGPIHVCYGNPKADGLSGDDGAIERALRIALPMRALAGSQLPLRNPGVPAHH